MCCKSGSFILINKVIVSYFRGWNSSHEEANHCSKRGSGQGIVQLIANAIIYWTRNQGYYQILGNHKKKINGILYFKYVFHSVPPGLILDSLVKLIG